MSLFPNAKSNKLLKKLRFSPFAWGCVACEPFNIQKECCEPDAKHPRLDNEMRSGVLAAQFELQKLATCFLMGGFLVGVLDFGSPAAATEWGKSGEFKLAAQTEPESEWSYPKNQWRKQHFFEKFVRGYEFKLAKLP